MSISVIDSNLTGKHVPDGAIFMLLQYRTGSDSKHVHPSEKIARETWQMPNFKQGLPVHEKLSVLQ
jgi:hypothetical protein